MPIAARHFKKSGAVVFAVFIWLLGVICLASAVTAIIMMIFIDRAYGQLFLMSMITYGFLRMIRFTMGRSLCCPLCHGGILQSKSCNMHRDARKWGFLSYPATLLADAAMRGRFVCMYCGTPFRLLR